MARLEELTAGASVRGLIPDGLATVVAVQWYGDNEKGNAAELALDDTRVSELTRDSYRPIKRIELSLDVR